MKEDSKLIAVAADVLALIGFPFGTFASSLLGQKLRELQEARFEAAREIALEALRRRGGRMLGTLECDEFVAITHRYFRAATEGVARDNLRLLANVMAGQIGEGSVHASDFHQYADTLSTLTPQEVVYLGTMARLTRERPQEHPLDNFHNPEQAVGALTRRELVPSVHFPNPEELRTCETALQRTGLVYRRDSTWDGEEILALSRRGRELARLADIESFAAGDATAV